MKCSKYTYPHTALILTPYNRRLYFGSENIYPPPRYMRIYIYTRKRNKSRASIFHRAHVSQSYECTVPTGRDRTARKVGQNMFIAGGQVGIARECEFFGGIGLRRDGKGDRVSGMDGRFCIVRRVWVIEYILCCS